ncbi:MAG: hypothetical protein U0800_11325 [Isosphaeraceae bacterium]
MPPRWTWHLLAIPASMLIGGLWASLGTTRGLAIPRETTAAPIDRDGQADVLKMLREVGDRSGYQVASGPILMMPDPSSKVLYPLEAVYYLDYRGARLLAILPTGTAPTPTAASLAAQGSPSNDRFTTTCVGRDLAADFAIPPEVEPRFLMTIARQGYGNGGWAPLFVIEGTTNQAISYRVSSEIVGGVNRAKFVLLDRIDLNRVAATPAAK